MAAAERNHAHPDRRGDCADERAEPLAEPALTVALHTNEAVPDQPAGEATEEDGCEGCGPSRRRGKRGQWSFVKTFGHAVIVGRLLCRTTRVLG